jgi:lipoprotein-anchoring transpeptidase ErfK/SrfK
MPFTHEAPFGLRRADRERRASGPGAFFMIVLALATALLLSFALPAKARELVAADPSWAPGQIVIRQSQRALYLVHAPGVAIRYSVGVGRAGKAWFGAKRIDGKHVEPAWAPPPEVKRDIPSLPDLIPGGSPRNPMGARALTLEGGAYAIHGTTRDMRRSIGTAASYGCIRMLNEDVIDLFDRVAVGTPVTVIP